MKRIFVASVFIDVEDRLGISLNYGIDDARVDPSGLFVLGLIFFDMTVVVDIFVGVSHLTEVARNYRSREPPAVLMLDEVG